MTRNSEKKILCSQFPEISSARVANCVMRITIDTRHDSPGKRLPVCISFYFRGTGERYFHPLGASVTREQYIAIAKANGRGRVSASNDLNENQTLFKERQKYEQLFNSVLSRIVALAATTTLTASTVQMALNGIGGETSFLEVWQTLAETKSINTRLQYLQARKSFILHVGAKKGFAVSAADIHKWCSSMHAAGNSSTTISIYLRACRVVWNHCIDKGYMAQDSYPFRKGDGKVTIPSVQDRKKLHLSVPEMKILYDFFFEGPFQEIWPRSEAENIHFSLGLFLVQYLGNGFNLADAARLTYNDFYYFSGGRAFQFVRQKTKDRRSQEVVIPITRFLKAVLDEIATEPTPDRLVFPGILNGATTATEEQKKISQVNQNIRKHMAKVTEHLGWAVRPTSTWCRHSFATNLTHAGVPERYISDAMGHSIGGGANVTSRYIDSFPLDKQLKYNALLLEEDPQIDRLDMLRDEISKLDPVDRKVLERLLRS